MVIKLRPVQGVGEIKQSVTGWCNTRIAGKGGRGSGQAKTIKKSAPCRLPLKTMI